MSITMNKHIGKMMFKVKLHKIEKKAANFFVIINIDIFYE